MEEPADLQPGGLGSQPYLKSLQKYVRVRRDSEARGGAENLEDSHPRGGAKGGGGALAHRGLSPHLFLMHWS